MRLHLPLLQLQGMDQRRRRELNLRHALRRGQLLPRIR